VAEAVCTCKVRPFTVYEAISTFTSTLIDIGIVCPDKIQVGIQANCNSLVAMLLQATAAEPAIFFLPAVG
jgi:hypothetical protein